MKTTFEEYWGIDVSKNWLDIAINDKVTRIKQDLKTINKFIKSHDKKGVLAILESTGGYEKLIARTLINHNITVHVAHPNKVCSFAKAKGRLAKTDPIDAHILKEYGKFINPEDIKAYPKKAQEELELLGARWEQLKCLHHQEACRLGVASGKIVKKSIKTILTILKKQLEQIENAILEIINSDTTLKDKYNLLKSMKGIGNVSAMTLITDLPELGEANKKEIAALVGVAPITKQSGQKTGRSSIGYGRQNIRKVLYMSALTACRYNPRFKSFYEKLVNKGKPKKIAIVAVMRKMIVSLNAMVQSNTHYLA